MKRCVPVLMAGLLLAVTSPGCPASAQVAPESASYLPGGYIDYQLNGKHHRHELSSFSLPSAYYKRSGNTEEFGLKNNDSNRMEHDTDDHYKSGRHVFEGDVQVFSGISQQSVVQVFGGGAGGPILMLKVYGRENGSLVVTRDTSRNLLTGCFDRGKIRIRIVHDVGSHRLTLYVNGDQKWAGADAGSDYKGGYNVKYGLYGTFKDKTHTIWSDVKTTG